MAEYEKWSILLASLAVVISILALVVNFYYVWKTTRKDKARQAAFDDLKNLVGTQEDQIKEMRIHNDEMKVQNELLEKQMIESNEAKLFELRPNFNYLDTSILLFEHRLVNVGGNASNMYFEITYEGDVPLMACRLPGVVTKDNLVNLKVIQEGNFGSFIDCWEGFISFSDERGNNYKQMIVCKTTGFKINPPEAYKGVK